LKREFYFALRSGQRVECPRCGNVLEVGEDSSVYCDYCHHYWTLAELLDHVNGGETQASNLADDTYINQPFNLGRLGPQSRKSGETRVRISLSGVTALFAPAHPRTRAPSREVM
jgi:hypothetical protein